MSWDRGDKKELDLSPGESTAISTSKSSTSTSSRPTKAFSRLPQEIMDCIQDYANRGHGQLRHDYRTPAFIIALRPDRDLYAEALRHYLRTNAHITIQNERVFLSKLKEEIERPRNLHITWGELRPDVYANIQSIIIDFGRNVPGHVNFILELVSQLPKLRRPGIRICGANEYNGRIEWSLSEIYARLGVVARKGERDAPDGAQLWFWEAEEGKVLDFERIREV